MQVNIRVLEEPSGVKISYTANQACSVNVELLKSQAPKTDKSTIKQESVRAVSKSQQKKKEMGSEKEESERQQKLVQQYQWLSKDKKSAFKEDQQNCSSGLTNVCHQGNSNKKEGQITSRKWANEGQRTINSSELRELVEDESQYLDSKQGNSGFILEKQWILQQKKRLLGREKQIVGEQDYLRQLKDQIQREKESVKQQLLLAAERQSIIEGIDTEREIRIEMERNHQYQLEKIRQQLKEETERIQKEYQLQMDQQTQKVRADKEKITQEWQNIRKEKESITRATAQEREVLAKLKDSLRGERQSLEAKQGELNRNLEKLGREAEALKKEQHSTQSLKQALERDRAEIATQKESLRLQKQHMAKQSESLQRVQQPTRAINTKPNTALNLNSKGLQVVDLHDYVNLITLDLSSNKLKQVDLKNNTQLTGLYLHYNQLTQVNTSKNTQLTQLQLSNNQLSELDLSANSKLERIYLNDNVLKSLVLWFSPHLNWTNNHLRLENQRSTRCEITFLYKAEHEQQCRALVEAANKGFNGSSKANQYLQNYHKCVYEIKMEARN